MREQTQPTAAQDFMVLRRAYTVLSSAELRAEYDGKLGLVSESSGMGLGVVHSGWGGWATPVGPTPGSLVC